MTPLLLTFTHMFNCFSKTAKSETNHLLKGPEIFFTDMATRILVVSTTVDCWHMDALTVFIFIPTAQTIRLVR